MQGLTAVVIGASGLTGNEVVQALLNDDDFSKVRILARSPLSLQHPKSETHVVNFADEKSVCEKLGEGDVIFCCIGTTRKKVKGDRNAYRQVDYDIPMMLARLGVQKGYQQYQLMSAIGANAFSGNFYLQLKGSLEEDIMVFPYQSIHIFRPSILLGKRQEFRLGELIWKAVTQVTSLLMLGSLRKFKPIQSGTVAKAMIAAVKKPSHGVEVYEYDEMMKLVKR